MVNNILRSSKVNKFYLKTHPVRLKIVNILMNGELSVGNIAKRGIQPEELKSIYANEL